MSRLPSELQRLYSLRQDADIARPGDVRAMVLELAGPADWTLLGKVWRGVQADLDLPAPAIAVSGRDGMQLWFSLHAPVGASSAADFLARLQARYLVGVPTGRVRVWPSGAPAAMPRVPAPTAEGNWSAFVAPDLAPIFSETPFLDIEPGMDGQAELLARLESIKPAAFAAALQRLAAVVPAGSAGAPPSTTPVVPGTAAPGDGAPDVDPRRFLQQVLNDETVSLALRIEAAKALLPRA